FGEYGAWWYPSGSWTVEPGFCDRPGRASYSPLKPITGLPVPEAKVATNVDGIPSGAHSMVKPWRRRNWASSHDELHSCSDGSACSQIVSLRPMTAAPRRSRNASAVSLAGWVPARHEGGT